MNPQAPDTVDRVVEIAGAPELRLQVRGYEEPPEGDPGADALEGEEPQALDVISDHLFETLRGDNGRHRPAVITEFLAGGRTHVLAAPHSHPIT